MKVSKAGMVDFLFGLGVPCIYNIQLGPEKSADAADTVSPSQPTTVAQFRTGERVGTCFLDGLGDLAEAGVRNWGCLFFRLKKA